MKSKKPPKRRASASPEALLEKLNTVGVPFDSLCDFSAGVQSNDTDRSQSQQATENDFYRSATQKDPSYLKELNGSDVSRYFYEWRPDRWASFGGMAKLPLQTQFFKGPRILVHNIEGGNYRIGGAILIDYHTHNVRAAYVEDEYVNNKSILNIVEKKETRDCGYEPRYFLALLNSALMSWVLSNSTAMQQKRKSGRVTLPIYKSLPIRLINFDRKREPAKHDELVSLVLKMEELVVSLRNVRFPVGASVISRQMGEIDKEIDKLIYQLYGLTDSEIKIVEREAK